MAAGTERIVQNAGDSTAATVGFTNVNGGTGFLTNANSVITFGNGIDTVVGFTSLTDTFASGTATALAAATNVNTLAAGNYFLRGTYAAGANTFTLVAAGADTLFIRTTGSGLGTAANNGTSATVFDGSVLVAADFVA